MLSNIFLNKENLLHNCRYLKEKTNKICAMIKANAYGHGSKEVVKILSDEVDFFGVSNQTEAEEIQPLTGKGIIVFGACDDYERAIREDISFILLSKEHCIDVIEISKKTGIKPRLHLCINSGMNRYGVRDIKEFKAIISILEKNKIELEGVYTHFSSLSTDEDYTKRQYQIFKKFISYIPKKWHTITHLGGGSTIEKGINADMNRVGLELYGYGNSEVKPVLCIKSQIVDIQEVKKGEHIGYLCGYTAKNDMKVATIPLGYGDGLPRKLSNVIGVKINGKVAKSCGNICMDAFMVDITNIDCNKKDEVLILDNATDFAKLLETTEYEVLTAFGKFRGARIIR